LSDVGRKGVPLAAMVLFALVVFSACGAQGMPPVPPGRERIQVRSSLDGTMQDSYLTVPSSRGPGGAPRPMAVALHSWSNDLESRFPEIESEAEERNWLLLVPNFRGRNDHPEACGSPLAQQDILDAVSWVRSHHAVDENRIYVLGASGGGFMTLLMAARHPQVWAAASAWVAISDLRAWYDEHRNDHYAAMMRGCFEGAPSDSEQLATVYRERSPLTHLRPDLGIPIDLWAGSQDQIVSPRHTLLAFRALAPQALSAIDVAKVLSPDGMLTNQVDGDTASDRLVGRRIILQRTTEAARLTLFDGGHEWFARAAVDWLARHRRPSP
jgi:pimeloyl-ACP methyl ester carboxylesterase